MVKRTPWSGDGLPSKPYLIKYSNDLFALAEFVNGGESFAGKYFTMNNNINLHDYWVPIGDYFNPFLGNFNGNYFVIFNMNILDNYRPYAGLFGFIGKTGSVSNLGVMLYDVTANGDGVNAGTIAGANYGTISNCITSGSIKSDSAALGIALGGIAGVNGYGASVSCCYNNGSVTTNGSADSCAGGIVGRNYSALGINDCYNNGEVKDPSLLLCAGGITGENAVAYALIKNCYNVGKIIGKPGRIGGVVGAGQATNCYYLSTCVDRGTNIGTAKTVAELSDPKFSAFLGSEYYISDFMIKGCCGSSSTVNGYPRLKVFAGSKNIAIRTASNSPMAREPIPTSSKHFAYGDGTKDLPFEVYNAEQFAHCCYHEKAHFIMKADFDYTIDYVEEYRSFSGVFNGNGHVINIKGIGERGQKGDYGLRIMFRRIEEGAVVKNLNIHYNNIRTSDSIDHYGLCNFSAGTIENCKITGAFMGSLMWYGLMCVNEPKGIVRNCVNEATISIRSNSSSESKPSAAAFVYNNKGIIEGCVNKGNMSIPMGDKNPSDISGIVRCNERIVKKCQNYGNISMDASKETKAGGICTISVKTGQIVDCANFGKLQAKYVWNIAGER